MDFKETLANLLNMYAKGVESGKITGKDQTNLSYTISRIIYFHGELNGFAAGSEPWASVDGKTYTEEIAKRVSNINEYIRAALEKIASLGL